MNRKMRRAFDAKTKLGAASTQVTKAMQALDSVQGLDAAMESLRVAQAKVEETHILINALVDDYQVLADELEMVRFVSLRMAQALDSGEWIDSSFIVSEGQYRAEFAVMKALSAFVHQAKVAEVEGILGRVKFREAM